MGKNRNNRQNRKQTNNHNQPARRHPPESKRAGTPVTANELIAKLQEDTKLTPEQRVVIFIKALDPLMIMQHVQAHQEVVKQTGIPYDPIYGMMTGVLRLARPDVFTAEEKKVEKSRIILPNSGIQTPN